MECAVDGNIGAPRFQAVRIEGHKHLVIRQNHRPGHQLAFPRQPERIAAIGRVSRKAEAEPQSPADIVLGAANSGDRPDPFVGGVLRVEEVTARSLERAEDPAEHTLPDVAIFPEALRLNTVVVTVFAAVERLLSAIINEWNAWRGQLKPCYVSDLPVSVRAMIMCGKPFFVAAARHVMIVNNRHMRAAGLQIKRQIGIVAIAS